MTEIREVGDYKLLEEIGRGGFGTVYKAQHKVLGKIRAVKIPADAKGAEAVAKESRILYQLKHPNIVEIETVNTDSTPPYIVMEYIPRNLRKVLQDEGRLGYDTAMRIFKGILKGMEYAHSQNVIHKDLKPSNILIGEDGEAKISDFGMAKILESAYRDIELSPGLRTPGLSISGVGTFPYIAPEVVENGGKGHSPRSDVYSLGIIFGEMLGRKPWHATPFAKLCPYLDQYTTKALEELVELATAEKPERRFESAGPLLSALEKIVPRAAEMKREAALRKLGIYAGSILLGAGVLMTAYGLGTGKGKVSVVERVVETRMSADDFERLREEHQRLLRIYESTSTSLADVSKEYQALLKKFEAEVSRDEKKEIENLRARITAAEGELDASKREVEKLTASLVSKSAWSKELERQLGATRNEAEQMAEKAKAEGFVTGYRKALEDCEKELEKIRKEIEKLRKEDEKFRREGGK